ncbi:MAG: hypothetical protein ACR2HZ_07775 [Gemmatimonadaceae bacterium]
MTIKRLLTRVLLVTVAVALSAPVAGAQWSRTYEQFYLPGSFNWQFLNNYPAAAKLFNAFDFGHAILYESLWTKPNAPTSELEVRWFDRLTKKILVNPPHVPLEEAAIEIAYAKLVPEAKQMFEWAHLLHRQIYDVWADERIPVADKDALVAEIIAYYKTRPDVAFSSIPKTMELMEGQAYSTAFRKNYPKFNGLIWAYHWLQVGLYEPLLAGKNADERQTGVLATVARFRQMIEDAPTWMPRVMPMTPSVAPIFTARYPEAAIIFDNLHSMHDVVSDILANPSVPRDRKRAEILLAARRYRDDTSFAQSREEWLEMAQMMGVQNMGGPVTGFLAAFPTPTVERGAVMAGMDHGNMPGMRGMAGMPGMGADSGRAGAMAGMDHSRMAHDSAAAVPPIAGMDHSRMGRGSAGTMPMGAAPMPMPAGHMQRMMDMHMMMLADTGIRRHILADTAMRRAMYETMGDMSPEHRAHMEVMLSAPLPAAKPAAPRRAAPRRTTPARTPTRRSAPTPARTPAPKAAPKPAPKPAPAVDHTKMGHPPPPPARKP